MATYAFVFWETLSNADKIALAAVIVSAAGIFLAVVALLPLLWGAVQWHVSLQASDTIQNKQLESFRSELDLMQEFVDSRADVDLRVGSKVASLETSVVELRRRASEMERRMDNLVSRK